jgi:hypothetical protein
LLVTVAALHQDLKQFPGKIEAESYDGMNSIQTDVCTDVYGGRYVGWINAGSWMDYNVNVTGSGTYSVNLRIAAPAAGSQLQIRNAAGSVLSTVNIPNTSSYLTWQTISTTVNLPAGNQTIRIYAVTAGWNINWVEFISQGASPGVSGPDPGYVALPATIESENYSAMYNVKTDISKDWSGGDLVGWINTGSWMDYNVYSQNGGQYTVNLRIASPELEFSVTDTERGRYCFVNCQYTLHGFIFNMANNKYYNIPSSR